MLAGHFGLAAIVKSREPQLPLWSLMLSTQLLDVLFVPMVALGYESYGPAPGTDGGYGELVFRADYTHSLVGALGISLVAMLVAMIPWGRRNGFILGAVVFSHWLLDLPVHRRDLPILPGDAGGLPRLGLGLWTIPWLTIALELILMLVGAYLYYHAAMRTAVVAERQEAKAITGSAPKGYRQRAMVASIALFIYLVATLAGDVLGI
jgi:hypothetical protein